ncbi:MAG: LptF/LptG family permease, partial [bacterium]
RNSGLRDPQSLKLSEEKREPKKLGHKLTVNDALPTQEVPSKVFLRKARLEQQQFKRLVQTDLNMIKNFERTNNKYMVEVHKKYSIPAACIVFVLIGAPLGILARQRGMAAAAISIVFFLLYWACLIGGETLADRQKLSPFLAMWAPNILVGIGGVFLVLRSVREAFTTRLELGRRFFNVLQKIRQAH